MAMEFNAITETAPDGTRLVSRLPQWKKFSIEHAVAELTECIALGDRMADEVAQKALPTFHDLVLQWEDLGDRIQMIINPVSHLQAVAKNDYPGIEKVKEELDLLFAAYNTRLSVHKGLYDAHVRFRESEEYRSLTSDEQFLINRVIKYFELEGVGLSSKKKLQLQKNNKQITKIGNRFKRNLQKAQDAWTKVVVDEALLDGISQEVREAMKEAAEKKRKKGFLVTLKQDIVSAILATATNRALREEVYVAYNTRASDRGPRAGKWDNAPVIRNLLAAMQKGANILGYPNYAELSLVKKMAGTVGTKGVRAFIEDVVEELRPKALHEFGALARFAKEKLGIEKLKPWDMNFASEAMLKAQHHLDQEALRLYFPFSKVMEGINYVLNKTLGVSLTERPEVETWSKDATYYELRDKEGCARGGLYMDLFSREGKRGGAWMDVVLPQRVLPDGARQLPIAYLICNFTKPAGGKEAYLRHDQEVLTLLHELGHDLHHLLGKTSRSELGMEYVEWDMVELPSQFMENYGWEGEMLKRMTAHKETGAPLPKEEIEKLLAGKFFHAALFGVRQFAFSAFDWELFAAYDPKEPHDANALWRKIQSRIEVRPLYRDDRFPNGFAHIFAGGYSAGYFSYAWALGHSADAYGMFLESGDPFSPRIGQRYTKELLEPGSSRPMSESFRAFRGRDLDPKALLREFGVL